MSATLGGLRTDDGVSGDVSVSDISVSSPETNHPFIDQAAPAVPSFRERVRVVLSDVVIRAATLRAMFSFVKTNFKDITLFILLLIGVSIISANYQKTVIIENVLQPDKYDKLYVKTIIQFNSTITDMNNQLMMALTQLNTSFLNNIVSNKRDFENISFILNKTISDVSAKTTMGLSSVSVVNQTLMNKTIGTVKSCRFTDVGSPNGCASSGDKSDTRPTCSGQEVRLGSQSFGYVSDCNNWSANVQLKYSSLCCLINT